MISLVSIGPVLFFLWLLLFAGFLRRDPGALVLPAAVLLLVYGGRLWSRLAMTRLKVEIGTDRDRLFPEDEFRLIARLQNDKVLPLRLRLVLPDPTKIMTGIPVETDEGKLSAETFLFSFENSSKAWNLTAPQRGVYRLGPVKGYGGDPTGLSEKLKLFPGTRELLVFPRLRRIKEPQLSFREFFGIHASKGPVEDPAWYAGTRDYSGNRPAKNIHWKASARLGKLQEKLFEPTSHRKVLFVLDIRGYLEVQKESYDGRGEEAFETCLEALGALVLSLMETGASFGLVTNAHIRGGTRKYLDIGRGPEHAGALLEILARLQLKEGENLEEMVYEVGKSGTGFIYMGYVPDSRSRIFFSLPAAQRKKIFFLFSTKSKDTDGESSGAPQQENRQQESPQPGAPQQKSRKQEMEPGQAIPSGTEVEPSELFQGYPAALVEEIFDDD